MVFWQSSWEKPFYEESNDVTNPQQYSLQLFFFVSTNQKRVIGKSPNLGNQYFKLSTLIEIRVENNISKQKENSMLIYSHKVLILISSQWQHFLRKIATYLPVTKGCTWATLSQQHWAAIFTTLFGNLICRKNKLQKKKRTIYSPK